jgi:hypothetical protein
VPDSECITQCKALAENKIIIFLRLGDRYGSGVRDKCEMPAEWALQFSKCPALCQGEILLDKVPSRYTRKFLLVLYTIENCFD